MTEPPADLLGWLNAYEWDDQQPDVAHKDHVYDAWCAICRGDLPRLLAALAEWADGALIDPSTWTRVTAARLMCPVHGDAACPEEYMLKSDGTPWAHYASYWHEAMRCGRRPTLTREDP